MKSKHTNGPWKTERKNCCTHIVSESKKGIHGWQSHITTLGDHLEYDGKPCGAVDSQDKTQAEINANAQLIAAAPEMLAALEKLTALAASQLDQSATQDGLENCKGLADARRAIAKAKEGQE